MKHTNLPRLATRLTPFTGRPDLIPLVNVLFLLLIFFVLTSNFVQVSGVEVNLPRTESVSTVGVEKFIITLAPGSEGQTLMYFNDRLVGWDALKEELALVSARSSQSTVIIRADQAVPNGVMTQVMALAGKAQLSSFIATLPPEPQTPTVFE